MLGVTGSSPGMCLRRASPTRSREGGVSVDQGLPWDGGFLSKQRKTTRVDARNQQPAKDQGEIPREKRKLFQAGKG